jgi:nicotinamide-nucleotide adenylyltransferase/phosphinothricin biosynthesis protein PhpF
MSTDGICATGVAHGRFQPLHLGHLEYLLASKAQCKVLVVGITNPDPYLTVFEPTDANRGDPTANPYTYYERYLMIEGALTASGVPRNEFRIVPFPHGFPERLRCYAPPDARYFTTIYDAWGEAKLERLRGLGLDVAVLWRRDAKVTTGSEIRLRIQSGQSWGHLVAPGVASTIRGAAAYQAAAHQEEQPR